MLKRQKFSLKRHIDNNINTYTYIVSGVATAIIFSSWWYPSGIDWSMSGNDIIQAAGQFATAGALAFGIWQYHQGKEVDRQGVLFEEGKLLLQRMGSVLNPDRLKNEPDDYVVLCDVMVSLINLSDHLEMIVDEIENPAQRAVLSFYWHELVYGGMTNFFAPVSYQTFVDYKSPEDREEVNKKCWEKYPYGKSNFRYVEFNRAVYTLRHPKSESLVGPSVTSLDILELYETFKKRFHDRGLIDKLILKDHRRPDMRVFAPFLAAIYVVATDKYGQDRVKWRV